MLCFVAKQSATRSPNRDVDHYGAVRRVTRSRRGSDALFRCKRSATARQSGDVTRFDACEDRMIRRGSGGGAGGKWLLLSGDVDGHRDVRAASAGIGGALLSH